MNILCVQTGGTIDKDYPTQGIAYSFEIADPAAKRVLDLVNPSFNYKIVELLKKDSTDITNEDRELIVKTCKSANEKHILITHGTDTMVETARALSSITDKIIVITGSMRPERFINSDASFNLGTGIGALSMAQEGVYIAMSGLVLPWDKVIKDYKQAKFVKK